MTQIPTNPIPSLMKEFYSAEKSTNSTSAKANPSFGYSKLKKILKAQRRRRLQSMPDVSFDVKREAENHLLNAFGCKKISDFDTHPVLQEITAKSALRSSEVLEYIFDAVDELGKRDDVNIPIVQFDPSLLKYNKVGTYTCDELLSDELHYIEPFEIPDGELDSSMFSLLYKYGKQECPGSGTRMIYSVLASCYASPTVFASSRLTALLRVLCSHMSKGRRYEFPLIEHHVGSEWMVRFIGEDKKRLWFESGISFRLTLLVSLLFYECVGGITITDLVWNLFLEYFYSDRANQKAMKSEVVKLLSFSGALLDPSLSMTQYLGGEQSRSSLTSGTNASIRTKGPADHHGGRQFAKAYYDISRKSGFYPETSEYFSPTMWQQLKHFVLRCGPDNLKTLGLLESMVELTGFRRGEAFPSIRDEIGGTDIVPPLHPFMMTKGYQYAKNLYSHALKEGWKRVAMRRKLSMEKYFSFDYMLKNLDDFIKYGKSAGVGSIKIGEYHKLSPDGKETTVIYGLVGSMPGLSPKTVHTTTKKLPVLLSQLPFIKEAFVANRSEIYGLGHSPVTLSPLDPGSTGKRFVPNKPPRLIFMIPLVHHIMLVYIAHLLMEGVVNMPEIFIHEEKGRMFEDMAKLSKATMDNDTITIGIDWSAWDNSQESDRVAPLTNAFDSFVYDQGEDSVLGFGGVDVCRKVREILIRANNSYYVAKSKSGEHIFSMCRLASGDANTSVRGSLDNFAQTIAMLEAILTDMGFKPCEFYTYGLPKTFQRDSDGAIIGIVMLGFMGDDVDSKIKVRRVKLISDKASIVHSIHRALGKYAAGARGKINEDKVIVSGLLAELVKKRFYLGHYVPRFSLSPITTEHSRVTNDIDRFARLLSLAPEWVVRGCRPLLINRYIIGLWAATAKVRIPNVKATVRGRGNPRTVDVTNFVSSACRYTYEVKPGEFRGFLSYRTLFLPNKYGGIGLIPLSSPSSVLTVLIESYMFSKVLGYEWLLEDKYSKSLTTGPEAIGASEVFKHARSVFRDSLDFETLQSSMRSSLVRFEDKYGQWPDRMVDYALEHFTSGKSYSLKLKARKIKMSDMYDELYHPDLVLAKPVDSDSHGHLLHMYRIVDPILLTRLRFFHIASTSERNALVRFQQQASRHTDRPLIQESIEKYLPKATSIEAAQDILIGLGIRTEYIHNDAAAYHRLHMLSYSVNFNKAHSYRDSLFANVSNHRVQRNDPVASSWSLNHLSAVSTKVYTCSITRSL